MVDGRSNAEWLQGLRDTGPEQAAALETLRELLRKALTKGLAARAPFDDALCEDVCQETLLKILGSLDSFQGRSQFTTWAITIGMNLAFTHLRRRERRNISLEDWSAAHDEPTGDFGSTMASNDARQRLLDVLQRGIANALTVKQRQALQGELQGIPIVQLTDAMEMSRNAFYKLTHDARKKLKSYLAEEGFADHEVRSILNESSDRS